MVGEGDFLVTDKVLRSSAEQRRVWGSGATFFVHQGVLVGPTPIHGLGSLHFRSEGQLSLMFQCWLYFLY